ncbi:hypothetical protein MNBD_GAMMA25-1283 [hydrothermal vent metagenome]|uniref:Nucleotide pyrophosphohydrolase n=1 Tax=hydrothermal vent metagenome TaxID=652676 RepID=A0A3B1B6H7_9ZZZZ
MSECDLSRLQKELLEFAQQRDWEQFHAPKNLVMALSVEASELLEHFQWMSEAQSKSLDAEKKQAVSLEMADIFIYLMRLATELDVDVLAAVEEKIKINNDKYPVEKVRGSSKKYTEYD